MDEPHPKCTQAPDGLEVYTCSDLDCPVHGRRNRDHAVNDAQARRFERWEMDQEF